MRTEMRARRTSLHVAAFVAVVVLCLVISRVPVPAVGDPGAPLGAPRLAYGYLYLPVLLTPVVASWLDSPMRHVVTGSPTRLVALETACRLVAALALLAAAGLVGATAEGATGAVTGMANAIWAVLLVSVLSRFMEWTWAAIVVTVYGAAGLFLPSMSVLLIGRDDAGSRLVLGLLGLILMGGGAVVALLARTRVPR